MTDVAHKALTLKQEAFCQAVITNDGNRAAAYRQAYDCQHMSDHSVYVEASRLADRPDIALRISELHDRALRLAGIDPAYILDGLIRNAAEAREHKQYSASNRAYELVGKARGMWQETQDVRHLHLHLRDERLANVDTDDLLAFVQSKQAIEAPQDEG